VFEALEKGKALPEKAVGPGFTATLSGKMPVVFEPQDTMHSFALGFTVRSQGTGDVATVSGTSVLVQDGKWAYKAADGSIVASKISADNQWHQILVSHYEARGETLFFVDGKLAGTTSEHVQPKQFALGGPRGGSYKDLLIYRAALNADEAAALFSGTLLQASLEIYAPLTESQFENRAQSLSVLNPQ
jgi:hypothetical protein